MISQEDKALLEKKGISEESVAQQLKNFATGFPFLKIEATASVGNGILTPDAAEVDCYLAVWDEYCKAGNSVVKFVPASGAASRMFKDLFSFLDGEAEEPSTDFEKKFFSNIEKFAFYKELDAACTKNNGASIKELMAEGKYKSIVFNLLELRRKHQ